jgi:5'-nucleotidase (lipoprotein e(P4) family)
MKKILFVLLLAAAGCSAPQKLATTERPNTAIADGKLFTAFFQQRAAEYRALCFQAYNFARVRLDQQLAMEGRPKAIITDIDETVLDNSAYAVHQGLLRKDWDQQSWYNWTALAEADTVPGAPSFLWYASARGVQIFYVTNRDEKERAATLKNLQKFRLPNADDAHLVLKQGTSSKEARRQQIMANYEVLLLLGDNLADFSSLFDKKTEDERKNNTNVSAGSFGSRFIVLPNANYGDWENAFYRYNYSLTAAQKDSIIRAGVRSY